MPTLNRRKELIYSDIRGDMEKHPVSDDLLLTTNENAVIESVKNLLLTDQYERVMQPRIGSQIKGLLFENLTKQTQESLKTLIIECIDNWEPRCILHDVEIVARPDENAVGITITFSLKNSDRLTRFDLLIDRVR